MYHGGRRKNDSGRLLKGDLAKKTMVTGIVERKGQIVVRVSQELTRLATGALVKEYALPQATIFTDEFASYSAIPKMEGMGYQHRRINHSQKVYVSGDVHTNTIEGFWSLVNAESAACTTRSARSIYRATLTSIRFGITAAIPGI